MMHLVRQEATLTLTGLAIFFFFFVNSVLDTGRLEAETRKIKLALKTTTAELQKTEDALQILNRSASINNATPSEANSLLMEALAQAEAGWRRANEIAQHASGIENVTEETLAGIHAAIESVHLAKKTGGADGKFRRVKFDPSRYPKARCNDGTQGVYYYAAPPERKKPENYIVMLQGGGWCSNKIECKQRMKSSHEMTSSAADEEYKFYNGLLSTTDKRNPLLDAHKVFLRYCSSDGFAGNRDAQDPASHGLHFRGSVIVKSVMEELTRTHGLASGDSLFFGGFSAGARGAMFNLDYVPTYIPPNIRVVGLLDSPFWLDIKPWRLSRQAKGVFVMANATGVLGDKCKAAFPIEEDQWKCLMGQYRMHYLEHHTVMAAGLYDGWQLGQNWNEAGLEKMCLRKKTRSQCEKEKSAYREEFAAQTKNELRSLPVEAGNVFSTTCGNHVTGSSPELWSIKIQNDNSGRAWSLRDMVELARDGKYGYRVIANCTAGQVCKGCLRQRRR